MKSDSMLIGIMSDSHDNVRGTKDALLAFSRNGVELVLFAGDMVGSGNCYAFEQIEAPIKLVFGNNDGDRTGLVRDFSRVGGEYLGDFGEIEVEDLKIALMHGTYEPLVKAVAASGFYEIVVRGHNHIAEDTQNGKTKIINPGEIWGHLTGRSSAAMLDTTDMSVDFIELGRYKTFREILKE